MRSSASSRAMISSPSQSVSKRSYFATSSWNFSRERTATGGTVAANIARNPTSRGDNRRQVAESQRTSRLRDPTHLPPRFACASTSAVAENCCRTFSHPGILYASSKCRRGVRVTSGILPPAHLSQPISAADVATGLLSAGRFSKSVILSELAGPDEKNMT